MKKIFIVPMALGMLIAGTANAFASDTPAPSTSQTTSANAKPPEKPHGCLAYGAGGAVAGHFVRSGHSVLGGAAGCAYGWHKKHEWKKEMKEWNKEHPKTSEK